MTYVRGLPLPYPAQTKDASPVVTGRIDAAVVNLVFRGWAASEELQARFNPWLELELALVLRDEASAVWAVPVHQLAGTPASERARFAQDYLVLGLAERGWSRAMVEAYLDTVIAAGDWRLP